MLSINGCSAVFCRINVSASSFMRLLLETMCLLLEQAVMPINVNNNTIAFFIYIIYSFVFNLTKTKRFCLFQGHACAITRTSNV